MTQQYKIDAIFPMVRDLLHELFGLSPDVLTESATIRDLGLDSMMVLDVMLEMEDRLGVKLTDMEIPANPTLGDVVAVIERNLLVPA